MAVTITLSDTDVEVIVETLRDELNRLTEQGVLS